MDLIGDSLDRYDRFCQVAAGDTKSAFAHPDMNKFLGGLRGGDLVIYVSRSGVGKSWTSLS